MTQQQKAIFLCSILFVFFIIAIVMCNRNDDSDVVEIQNIQIKSSEQNNSDVFDDYAPNITNKNCDSLIKSNDLSLQQSNLEQWSEMDLQQANTAVRNNNLSKEEKQIILYTNLARLNGAKFCKMYVSPLANRDPNNSYIKSLISDLNTVKDLPMLYPNEKLINAAKYHAKDMSTSEDIRHDSSDGTPFDKRLIKFGYNKRCGENVAGGRHDPLGVVLDLLVDEGIPDVGHRKNILDKYFNAIGVSRNTHPKYYYNFVMDFGQD